MEENVKAPQVSVVPKLVFGLRNEVIGNVLFNYNQELIYPVEAVLVFHDLAAGKQRFLRLPENTIATNLALSTNRRVLAAVEVTKTDTESVTNIAVYDTTNLKKRRNFELPAEHKKKQVSQVAFIYDGRGVIVLTKPPSQILFNFFFDKTGTVVAGPIMQPGQRGTATCIAGNPQDCNLIAVFGDGVLKMISKTETGFTTSINIKAHISVKCLAWLSMEMLILGLKRSKLALIENGEIKITFRATEDDFIDTSKEPEADKEGDKEKEKEKDPHEVITTITAPTGSTDVTCIVAQSKSIAYAIGNEVFFFEKISKYKYQRLAIIKLPVGAYPEDLYKITNMAVNQAQDTVVITARHTQIYTASVKGLEFLEFPNLISFKPFGESLHIDEIVDLSVCAWRTIVMTASKDKTIRVWNYETGEIELIKKYQVDISATELNPTGQFAAIGFSDQLRIMQIFMDDLNIIKTYNFPRCSVVKYSFFGHLMASAYYNYVSITSVYTLEIIRTLKGHNGNVLSLAWSRCDKFLVSGGAEGAIYQWDVETGDRVQEIVQKGTEYRALRCTGEPLSYFSVTGSGLLRQLANSELIREFTTPEKTPFLYLALARSDLMMFVSTNAGHLYNVQLPFLEAGGGTFTNNRFFDSAVTRLAFSHDDTLLITASKRGTLVIWVLQNIDGKVSPLDPDLLRGQEVLIPRQVLKEKLEQIENLQLRIHQQAAEFQYQQSQNEIFESQQLADIHKGYCTALETLKTRNNDLEQRHIEELNAITFQINDLKTEQKKQSTNLSEQFTERMLMEYQKYISFDKSGNEIKDSYEQQLRESAGFLQDSVEALEVDFKKQIDQRDELIRDLMQEMQDEKYEFNEYCRQVEAENEANMMDAVIRYENMLKAQQDETVKWRGRAGVLRKKSETMSKEAERVIDDVDLLNEEDLKNQKTIKSLLRTIEDLRKDVTDREFAISVKEKRIQEILHKEQELEKYKQVLSHRITELKMKIEPLECHINERRKQITNLENRLNELNKSNILLEDQLKELSEKYRQTVAKLKKQRRQAKKSREFIYTICSDIYHVSGKMNDAEGLKRGTRLLFQKYSNEETLKKHIMLETQVLAEFNRQRRYIEHSIYACKRKMQDKSQSEISGNLLKENLSLLEKYEEKRKEVAALKNKQKLLEVKVKLFFHGDKRTVNSKIVRTLEYIEEARDNTKELKKTIEDNMEMARTKRLNLQEQLEELVSMEPTPK